MNALEKKRYNKIYRRGHEEYFKEYQKSPKRRTYVKKWNDEHKESKKKWNDEHRELRSVWRKEWRERNPDYNRKYYKTWEGKANKQRSYFKRRTREEGIINTLTSKEWLDILEQNDFKCFYCGKPFDLFNEPTRDHVIPISKGGDNTKENILPACRSCNARKNNRLFKRKED